MNGLDAWLGRPPWRPYNPPLCQRRLARTVRISNTSCIGEWGCTPLRKCHVALGWAYRTVFYGYVNNRSATVW